MAGVSGAPTSLHRISRRASAWWGSIRLNAPFWWMGPVDVALWLGAPSTPWHDPAALPGTAALVEHWAEIRDELDAVLASGDRVPTFQDIDPAQRRVSDDDQWQLFILRFVGNDCEENRARCPRTAALVDEVPGMWTAMFSILGPGKVTPWHGGGIKGVLRYHLAMVIPDEDRCWMQIARHGRRHWCEGQAMAFDDGYMHRAANQSDAPRVVLWLDIERVVERPWLARLNRWALHRLASSDRLQAAIESAPVRAG